jgi:small subunit ribosomal protein S17
MPKTLKGTIVSDKMNKTVVVNVEHLKKHPRYGRYYKSSKKYKAHDERGEFHVGDKVLIKETKPISKDKYFKVVSKI